MSDVAGSSRDRSRPPATEPRSHSEKWSVSRTSNFFVVGLLLPILSPEPDGLLKIRVVLKYGECAPRVFFYGREGLTCRSTQRLSSLTLPHVFQASATCREHRPSLPEFPQGNARPLSPSSRLQQPKRETSKEGTRITPILNSPVSWTTVTPNLRWSREFAARTPLSAGESVLVHHAGSL